MGIGDDLANNDQMASVNRVWTAPNVEDVTINIVDSGTETDATKFLNKGLPGTGYSIIADQDFEIIGLSNGGIELLKGDPIQVAINTRRTRVLKQPTFTQLTIRILTASTTVQLEVF